VSGDVRHGHASGAKETKSLAVAIEGGMERMMGALGHSTTERVGCMVRGEERVGGEGAVEGTAAVIGRRYRAGGSHRAGVSEVEASRADGRGRQGRCRGGHRLVPWVLRGADGVQLLGIVVLSMDRAVFVAERVGRRRVVEGRVG
jgi:hypothetical protein